jgi:hypothetical protein
MAERKVSVEAMVDIKRNHIKNKENGSVEKD